MVNISTIVSDELYSWMQDIRRQLHAHPELSFKEFATSEFICEKLTELGIDSFVRRTGTGISVDLGPPESALLVGLRADMDALPIAEDTGLSFSSVNGGVMHACGHDGHVAMLLGAAALLQKMPLPGRVRLLFQPAEECGNGAVKMIEAGVLADMGMIFSGHIDTHYPAGAITVDEGIICAYADPFTISLQGNSGHAARPHEANDVIVAATSLVTSIQTLISREVDPNHAAVVTIGSLHAGETHNVIAEKAVLQGTIRSTHPDARKRLISGLKRMVNGISTLFAIHTILKFANDLPAVINSAKGAAVARDAASVVSPEGVMSQGLSSLGGEDFAFYLQEIDGCLVRFGAQKDDGSGPAHSSTFDFDENVLSIGAAWYAEVAMQYLQEKSVL